MNTRRLPLESQRKKRFTGMEIIEAYKATGSVWEAGKQLGIAGQTVHERLKALDYPMLNRNWSQAEVEQLKSLASECTIGEIANRLGRPYAGVACKISELGIGNRFGGKVRARKQPRPYGTARVKKLIDQLERYRGSIFQFCRLRDLSLDSFVGAIQRVDPKYWENYTARRSDLTSKICPNCNRDFYPLTKKQQTCSRRCTTTLRADRNYFGGKRKNTIGLADGVCQLCMEPKDRLQSHHVLGKQNDPENDFLIALCNGCHQLVTMLAARRFVDDEQGWENLISLAMSRRLADKNKQNKTTFVGVHAAVDLEWLTAEEIEELAS